MTPARTVGAVAGGLLAGIALSAVMLLSEKANGKPSELIELERKSAARLGIATPSEEAHPTMIEQVVTHGGHLILSALAGLAYAATVDDDADDAITGATFGAAFFVAAYGIIGPMLRVTPLPWRQPPVRAVQHPIVHGLFGLLIASFARKAARRTS